MDLSSIIWTEKYRPLSLKDIVGQSHVIARLQAFVSTKTLPHCLFAGPAGSGKSTASVCIARELYGNAWKGNFLELNASDERGIDTVRVKIKDFARTISLGNTFKIIFLDEADSLTKDAQNALRRTMENYSNTARFILSVNYSSKIIAPIQSRTAVFRFSPLTESQVITFLEKIAKAEKISIDDKALSMIFYISEGDMRKAINILQSAAVTHKEIDKDVILSVTSSADPDAVRKMMLTCIEGDFLSARDSLRKLLIERGLSGEDIIKEIHNQVFNLDINDEKKVELLAKIGEYEFRLTEGSNTQIQLEALLAQFLLMKK